MTLQLTDDDLQSAMATFAVANTPLYVVRKLRNDQTVLRVAGERSGQILHELSVALTRNADNIRDAVLPYVYLVALAVKQDSKSLDTARRLEGKNHDWYGYISQAIFESIIPTTIESVTTSKSSSAFNIERSQQQESAYQFSSFNVGAP